MAVDFRRKIDDFLGGPVVRFIIRLPCDPLSNMTACCVLAVVFACLVEYVVSFSTYAATIYMLYTSLYDLFHI